MAFQQFEAGISGESFPRFDTEIPHHRVCVDIERQEKSK
jgi:hypothetical protein